MIRSPMAGWLMSSSVVRWPRRAVHLLYRTWRAECYSVVWLVRPVDTTTRAWHTEGVGEKTTECKNENGVPDMDEVTYRVKFTRVDGEGEGTSIAARGADKNGAEDLRMALLRLDHIDTVTVQPER